jgi:hypothetical protein
MKQLTQIPDLSFSLNKDGSIDLEQRAGCGEVDRISLHSCQVRHLFECASHLLPPTPANELTERLAVQLCEMRDGLEHEFGRSPGINALFFQATTACNMIPDAIYPLWMYEKDSPPPVAKAATPKQRPGVQLADTPTQQHPQFELKPPPKE